MPANPRVREIMSAPVETVPRDAPVSEAASRMRAEGINALLVSTSPPSIITSADILGAVAEGRDVSGRVVSELMTESVETVPPTLRAAEAAAMMTSLDIDHLPVVDSGDYVGIISSSDITEQFA